MAKNLILDLIFGPPPKSFCEFYLYQLLDIVTSYHPMQFKGKLINQTWENAKKYNFGPNFGTFGPNLLPHPSLNIFPVGFTSTRF